MTKTDCDGNVLRIGDRIAIQALHYKNLRVKRIARFTDKRVVVENSYGDRFIEPDRVAKVWQQ